MWRWLDTQPQRGLCVPLGNLDSLVQESEIRERLDLSQDSAIAIVGLGIRLPGGACDATSLWANLRAGVDAIVDVPRDRWDPRRFQSATGEEPGKTYAGQGGFLQQSPYEFDAGFFGMSPREAAQLDPQQRLLLETTWEAIEDAGWDHHRLKGRPIGVYVGGFTLDTMTQRLGLLSRDAMTSHTAMSSTMVMLSNRISHAFDFQGPSMTVDTACSSSLVATHLACHSIWRGESEIAFACGVNVMLRPELFLAMSKGGFLSKSGRCRAFDAAADGYVRGEGAGVVALKPLAQAQADGDRIYALIHATGLTQDGHTPGIALPSGASQERLLRQVYARAGISADDLAYIEAHGPGTQAGDPIEANSLGSVLGMRRRHGNPVWIGSVKTNIGHTEAAAGVAGLIKAALVVQRREVPPNLHFHQPNPKIDFDRLQLRVPTRVEPLPAEGVLYAAVNSFGYGGTNAHVVLGSAALEGSAEPRASSNRALGHRVSTEASPVGPLSVARPFPVSAADRGALASRADSLASVITDTGDLDALGYALTSRATQLRERAVVWASDARSLREGLAALQAGSPHAAVTLGLANDKPHRLMFVYTGMGAQYGGMGRALYASHAEFRTAIDEFDSVYASLGGSWSVRGLFSGAHGAIPEGAAIEDPIHAQPANLALQVALTRAWRSFGVEPDAVIGHSVGEVAAFWAAGALTLAQAVQIIHARSSLQQELLGKGGMLAVGLAAADVARYLEPLAGRVEVAGVNAPDMLTLCGEPAALRLLHTALEAAGVFARPLHVGVAYHGRQMEEVQERYAAQLRGLTFGAPSIPLYSTVLGRLFEGAHDLGDYMCRNAREPVRFQSAIDAAMADGFSAFLEVGPNRVLGAAIVKCAKNLDLPVWTGASMQRGQPADATLAKVLADLHCAGAAVDFSAWFPKGGHLRLPRYPWQRVELWAETDAARDDLSIRPISDMLQQRVPGIESSWRNELSEGFYPYLRDHVVAGDAILPAAGYIAMALAAMRDAQHKPVLERFSFDRTLSLEANPTLLITLKERTRDIALHARNAQGEAWRKHASAVSSVEPPQQPPRLAIADVRARCPRQLSVDDFYAGLAQRGLAYGPSFRGISRLQVGRGECLAELTLPAGLEPLEFEHPVLLDAGFQSLFALADASLTQGPVVPVSIQRIEARGPMPARVIVHGILTSQQAGAFQADLSFVDLDSGEPLVRVLGLRLRAIPVAAPASAKAYEEIWESLEALAPDVPGERKWLVLGAGAADEDLARSLEAEVVPLAHLQARLTSLGGAEAVQIVYADAAPLGSDGGALCDFPVLARALRAAPLERTRVTIVTRDAVPIAAAPQPEQAARWGLGRVLATEDREVELRLVDLAASVPPGRAAQVLRSRTDERELRVTADGLYAPRMRLLEQKAPARSRALLGRDAVRLIPGRAGEIEDLRWVACERRAPGPDEVEIRTTHTALNFKDVMKVLGMLSESYLHQTFFGSELGMETAGEISAVGERVTDYRVGDRVVVMNPRGSFTSYTTTGTHHMVRWPAPLAPEATPVLINYVTAYYGLSEIARMKPGQTLLIHSAAGGVGQAAVALARHMGVQIFATAGSEEKRAYLRDQGILHVFNSRSLEFVHGLREATRGRGVDVVLNALSGEFLIASWNLLAPYGHFLEIGKRDLEDNTPLPLGRFDENRSFSAFDIDRMLVDRPELFRSMLDQVVALLNTGQLPPLPVSVFKGNEVVDAFRAMSRAKHVGKVVVEIAGHEVQAEADPHAALLRPDRTYLVTGGLSGFGASLAAWLVQQGGRHIWLVGRRGVATPGAEALKSELEAQGATVRIDALDIADERAFASCLRRVGEAMPPVGGVFHAAMVLADAPLVELDASMMQRSFSAKAHGADILDRLTRHEPLEHFVLFSSISGLIGNAGQGGYVAANCYLDALAHRRRAAGLPGLSVNWGVISDTGVVARDAALGGHLERMGVKGLTSRSCLQALAGFMRAQVAQACFADVDWTRWAQLSGERSSRFAELVQSSHDRGGRRAEFRQRVLASGSSPTEEVLAILREELGRVMQLQVEQVPTDRPLDGIGVDSLMSVELSSRVEAVTGIALSTSVLMRGPTLEGLTAHLLSELLGAEDLDEDDVDNLSDQEADALLKLLAETGALEQIGFSDG